MTSRHVIRPLSGTVIKLLGTAKRRSDCSYVCPGQAGDRPYGGLPGAWRRLAKSAQLQGITLHTLRHSFASVAADLGYAEPTIAALLGHSSGTITGRYVHHLDAVLLRAADRVANVIQGYMLGELASADVIKMRSLAGLT